MKYLADDGKIFATEEECINYENSMNVKKLNKRCCDQIYGEYFSDTTCLIDFYDVKEHSDLLIIKSYYQNKVCDLYGFEEDEIKDVETVNKYPFTAVVLNRKNEWAELLLADKTKLIKEYEDFIIKLKEM